jgi:hypothetical protein
MAADYKHLEDLDPKSFIDTVRRLGQLQVSEKLDGSVFWFGLDEAGNFYTSRPNAHAERFHSEADYPNVLSNNSLRSAHAALEVKLGVIKAALLPGDAIVAEAIFGKQEKTAVYGADGIHYIAILDSAEGTNELKVSKIIADFANTEVEARSMTVESSDGTNIDRKLEMHKFRFVTEPPIHSSKLKGVNVNSALKKLELWLDNVSGVDRLTNLDLLTADMSSIPAEQRDAAKSERKRVTAELKSKFQLPIKRELLSGLVSKLKPTHGPTNPFPNEDNGVAGVNIKDPTTGGTYKLVDTDGFGTIKAFNNAVIDTISGSVRTTDDEAPLEQRGGVVGLLRIQIAKLLGNQDLAINREARKIFAGAKGSHATETLRSVAATLRADDYLGTQRKIEALGQHALVELDALLTNFKKHQRKYTLKLKTGRTIGLSPEVIKRTYGAFAEAKSEVAELIVNVNKADSLIKLVGVLYGKDAVAAHATKNTELHEGLLSERRVQVDISHTIEVPDFWTLMNVYFATVLASVVIYKAQDNNGVLRFVRDQAHHRLNRLEPGMSALNYWGYLVWKSNTPRAVQILGKKLAAEMSRIARKVPEQHVRFLHMELSFGKMLKINWDDHLATMIFLQKRTPSLNTERINNLIEDAFRYDTMTFDEKVKFLPRIYFYVQQFVPMSPLQPRLRIIQDTLLQFGDTANTPTTIVMAPNQKLLGEDGEIAAGPDSGPAATPTTGATSTNSGSISNVQGRAGRHPNIEKRTRKGKPLGRDGQPLGVMFRRPPPGGVK